MVGNTGCMWWHAPVLFPGVDDPVDTGEEDSAGEGDSLPVSFTQRSLAACWQC